MSTVYVTQIPSRHSGGVWVPTMDVTAAREHGELRILLPSGLNYPDGPSAVKQLKTGLEKFNPDEDSVLLLGDPVVQAAGAAILGERFGYFSMLKWDRQVSRYNSYEINLGVQQA